MNTMPKISDGEGALFIENPQLKPGQRARTLQGIINFEQDDRWGRQFLSVPMEAWIEEIDGQLRYGLSIGGLCGFLDRCDDGNGAYVGCLGPNSSYHVCAHQMNTGGIGTQYLLVQLFAD